MYLPAGPSGHIVSSNMICIQNFTWDGYLLLSYISLLGCYFTSL